MDSVRRKCNVCSFSIFFFLFFNCFVFFFFFGGPHVQQQVFYPALLGERFSTQLVLICFPLHSGCQRSGGSPSHLTSTYLARMLQTGAIQKHISTVLCPAYAQRYRILMLAVKQHLQPLGFTAPQPNREVVGGYFVWLGLPGGLKGTELSIRLQQDYNLIVAPGKIFEVPGDESAVPCDHSIRLCFAWEDEEKLTEGVRRIASAASMMLQARQHDNSEDFVVVDKDTTAPCLSGY